MSAVSEAPSQVKSTDQRNLKLSYTDVTGDFARKQLWCDGEGVFMLQDGERKGQSAQRKSVLF